MFFENKYFKAFILSIISFNFIQAMKIEKRALFIPQQLGDISAIHDDHEFKIEKNAQSFLVKRCYMDKELRGISQDKLSRLIKAGAYLAVTDIGKNEYSLKLNGRLNGGGVFGTIAGAWIGKSLVSLVGHGSIALVSGAVSIVATPAAGIAVSIMLESTLGVAIEAASLKGAIAGGIMGGVATGPV